MNKLLVVDGNSVLYRGFYALPLLSNKEGLYTNAVYGFCNIFIKALKSIQPTHVVVAFDYGKKTFRNELYADYKVTRKETPQELVMQFPIIKEVLQSMGIKYIEMEGLEGDDIIGSLSKKFDIPTIILTGDRDTLQLIDDTTTVYLTKKGITDLKVYDEKELLNDKGITPSQVVDVKALMGDASDNIPGVAGIGEKGAYKLIIENGSLENVYKNIDSFSAGLKSKLENGKESAFLSYKLGTIKTDCDIDCSLDEIVLHFPFKNSFREVCKKYDFTSLLKADIFDNEIKEEVVDLQIVELKSVEEIQQFARDIEKEKSVALDVSEVGIDFCFNDTKVYSIRCGQNLLSLDFDIIKVARYFKDLFKSKNVKKYFFDLKNVKKLFYDKGIEFQNCEDVALMQYLLMANDKDIEKTEFLSRYKTSILAQAIYLSINNLEEKLQEYNLVKLYREIELPLVDTLLQMEINGIKIDKEKLFELNEKYMQEIDYVSNQIFSYIGKEINLNSPKQLASVLFDDLGIKVVGNKKNSTSVDILQKIENAHPVIPLILRYRKLVKIKGTYIDSYINFEKNGYIHSHFLQMVTGTGRLSSKEPNLQNIPVRDDESKNIREIFVSRFENGYIISFDYDQIELKLMAHFSQDDSMVNAFLSKQDIHRAVASKIYHIPLDEVTAEQRRKAKSVNFGIIYGQGAYGLSNNLEISVKSAQEFMQNYFATFPKVKEYMERSIDMAKANNLTAVTLFGRRRYIPELDSKNFQLRSFGERVAINMPLQGSASDIIKLAMNKITNKLNSLNLRSKLILQVHDELVFDVHPEEVDILEKIAVEEMQGVVKLLVPLTVSEEKGKTLYK